MNNSMDWQELFGSDDDDYENESTTTKTLMNTFNKRLPHVEQIEQIPGLSLWHGALDHAQQMTLTEAIIEAGIFGHGNQAFRFKTLGPHLDALSAYIQESNVLPPSLSCRLPLFDQAIYNRYNKGEGLISHVDLAKFDDGIIILSLLSSCCMTMKPAANPQQSMQQGYSNRRPQSCKDNNDDNLAIDILLRPGDILILSGPSRYLWEHGIAERDVDIVGDEMVVRGSRISVTLRKLIEV